MRLCVAYGVFSFALQLVHSTWTTYVYASFLQAPVANRGGAFGVALVLFGIWNSINDPLLGWMSDHSSRYRGGCVISSWSFSAFFRRGRRKRSSQSSDAQSNGHGSIRMDGQQENAKENTNHKPLLSSLGRRRKGHPVTAAAAADMEKQGGGTTRHEHRSNFETSAAGEADMPARRRLPFLRRGGVILCVAFLVAWFPPQDSEKNKSYMPVLHFFFSLCLYDWALSSIEVNYAALLADLSLSAAVRAECTSYSSVMSVLGVLPLLMAQFLWHRDKVTASASTAITAGASAAGGSRPLDDEAEATAGGATFPAVVGSFHVFCFVIVIIAMVGFHVACSDLERALNRQGAAVSNRRVAGGGGSSHTSEKLQHEDDSKDQQRVTVRLYVRQLWTHNNFRWFSTVRLLQVALCSFEKNHLALFLSFFVGSLVPSSVLGLCIAGSFAVPHIVMVLLQRASTHVKYGARALLRALFYLRIGIVLVTAFVSAIIFNVLFQDDYVNDGSRMGEKGESPLTLSSVVGNVQQSLPVSGFFFTSLIVVYLCTGRIMTELICRHFPLVLSDLTDEDQVLFSRSKSMAASIVGASAFIAKPGETIAPLVGWYLFRYLGYGTDEQEDQTDSPFFTPPPALESGAWQTCFDKERQRMWFFLLMATMAIVSLQALAWSRYTLHGEHHARVRRAVSEMHELQRHQQQGKVAVQFV